MSLRLRAIWLACGLVLASTVWSANVGLQASTSGWSGLTVTVQVKNTTSGALTGRVRVHVALADGTHTTLTSAPFVVPGGATITVSIPAPQIVSAIDDNPEPIGVLQL